MLSLRLRARWQSFCECLIPAYEKHTTNHEVCQAILWKKTKKIFFRFFSLTHPKSCSIFS